MATYQYRGRATKTFQKLPAYRNLAAWQAASDLVALVTQFTARLGPPHWRLSNQMRGAAISVGGNIAEGYCSGTLPNYIRYCNVARGSLGEFGSYLQDCEREALLTGAELDRMLKHYGDATYFLDRLTQALVAKAQAGPSDQPYAIKEASADYDLTLLGDFADDDPVLPPSPAPESPESLESPSP